MQVERVRPGAALKTARPAAGTEGFGALLDAPPAEGAPDGGAEEALGAGAAAAAGSAAQIGSRMTYESARDAVLADRHARRHGRAMLQALGALQATLLGGGPVDAPETLAELAAGMPEADDPVLRLILREISVRAAVELARHRAQANISIG